MQLAPCLRFPERILQKEHEKVLVVVVHAGKCCGLAEANDVADGGARQRPEPSRLPLARGTEVCLLCWC